jgi:hypothetical protein
MISSLLVNRLFFADSTPEITWDSVTLDILGLCGLLTVLYFLIIALSQFRDNIVESGFVSKDGWLGRQMERHMEFKLKKLLELIGFTEDHRQLVREAHSRAQASEQVKADDTSKLVEQLLAAMRRCMVVESNGQEFRHNTGKFYVDIMGAVSVLGPAEWDFAMILAKWLHILRKESLIQAFDAILTPKNGNPALTHRAAAFYATSTPPIVLTWKSREDHSRVSRGNSDIPHFLDFEGLWAFRKKLKSAKKIRVIAVDDNFTTGETLAVAIEQFNNLVQSGLNEEFEPIDTAVALFAINSDGADRNFRKISSAFQVHTLVSVGIPELSKLASNTSISSLMQELSNFQAGFSCKESRRLSLPPTS